MAEVIFVVAVGALAAAAYRGYKVRRRAAKKREYVARLCMFGEAYAQYETLLEMCELMAIELPIKTRTRGLKTYQGTFRGKDVVQWLMTHGYETREEALNAGDCMIKLGFLRHASKLRTLQNTNALYGFALCPPRTQACCTLPKYPQLPPPSAVGISMHEPPAIYWREPLAEGPAANTVSIGHAANAVSIGLHPAVGPSAVEHAHCVVSGPSCNASRLALSQSHYGLFPEADLPDETYMTHIARLHKAAEVALPESTADVEADPPGCTGNAEAGQADTGHIAPPHIVCAAVPHAASPPAYHLLFASQE